MHRYTRNKRKAGKELRSACTYKKKITGAIGSNEKAAIARIEGEGEIVDERSRSRRRVAVDARVGEAQAVYLDGRSHRVHTPLLLPHLLCSPTEELN